MSVPRFKRIALIGIGLIGSSIARAVRRDGLADEIVGYARTEKTRKRARELALVDRTADTAVEAVADADLVVIGVPVCASGTVAREIAPALAPGAIVTDVGSVKASVVKDVEPHIPAGVSFVGGHPIAGTEHSGPDAGFPELFDGRWCVLTPAAKSTDAATARLAAFWTALGSHVEIMAPDRHDLVLAITSHVPHLIAYNIVATANDLEQVTEGEVIKFSAGGFRDFTRIASSDPVMWRDVFLSNKEAVLETLGRFSEDLAALQRAIRWEDGDRLLELFARAREIRHGIVEAGQDTDAPDFGRPHGPSGAAGKTHRA